MGRKPGATVDEKRKIVALKVEGLSVVEIAKTLNRCRSFIYNVLRDSFLSQDFDNAEDMFVQLENRLLSFQ